MDDPLVPGALPEDSSSESPDVMNDPEYAPPQRRDTASSAGFGDTCRICRSEGTPEEPLFYPCKCSGSIKFVHQECLMEWLSHSHKKHCELCKTPFRFTKLYDANMPKTLPWTVFVRRACIHVVMTCVRAFRALLVSVVWLVALPWLIRWAWRWMFWFADAGWAREAFIRKMQIQNIRDMVSQAPDHTPERPSLSLNLPDSVAAAFQHIWGTQGQDSENPTTVENLAAALSAAFQNATTSGADVNATEYWPQSDSSILSSWTYISELTSNKQVNRVVLDIFEGQLITCVVIIGFILVFLIREWVVQQQPLVNLDNLNHEIRERERLQRERERLRRQAELLDQARERLFALQEEANTKLLGSGDHAGPEYQGWEALSASIDFATNILRDGSDDDQRFTSAAVTVLRQVRAAESKGTNLSDLADKVFEKLATLSDDERQAWEEVLVSELQRVAVHKEVSNALESSDEDSSQAEGSAVRRPPMPNRDSSSRATQIQRFLEEADGTLNASRRHSTIDHGREANIETHTESASVISAPSTDTSWQQVSPPAESSDMHDIPDHVDIFQEDNDEIPITNAGPDAKINIKRSGKDKTRAIVPAPNDASDLLTDEELTQKLNKGRTGSSSSVVASAGDSSEMSAGGGNDSANLDNPFHPDGANPEPQEQESLRDRVASAFREEFGLEGAQNLNPQQETDADGDTEHQPGDVNANALLDRAPPAPPNALHRLIDWFWGDIQPQGAPEPAPMPNEELLGEGDNAQEAPFVPVQDLQAALVNVPHDEEAQENDPEVLAAAQQAGLDAEAIEDAEDLEGIFELIGLQGPLIGLFQTSCFCSVLVTGTVYGAVGLPYVWGKLVLSFIGSPVAFMIKTPLQVASFIADLLIDLTLVIGGWLIVITTVLSEFLIATIKQWLPGMGKLGFVSWIADAATSTAAAAGARLQHMFSADQVVSGGDLGWNWAMLGASMHAHASLKDLQEETNAVLNYVGSTITSVVDTISSGSVSVVWQRSFNAFARVTEVPARIVAGVEALDKYKAMYLDIVGSLRSGALTFQSSTRVLDPHLVYWNTSDRGLAVLTGYAALALIAAVYVALDTPITRSQSGQKTEKVIRDTLRQAGGVLKVILIISIEMLVFPLYCGLLLDLAFLPLFPGASVATRWAFAIRAPNTFCFVHWFVGTCYMFHFALFVGMCRKILRKGVLWFIRDPDDPTFHPVRDVLERNVTTQLRKIAFSALVYGALVILCLGGVIWSIGKIFKGIFPIHWTYTEPVLEFPMDLLLYNLATPILIKLFRPSQAVHALYAWWLRRCARLLRLSHFLFGDRRKDEEGRQVRKSWVSFLLMRRANPEEPISASDPRLTNGEDLPEVYFRRDGKYVMTPCNDQYRPPKPGEAFLHSDDGDVYIADKDGKKNDHFAKVYIPPFFRLRVTLFMVCLWMFSAFAGLCATLVPLVVGRSIFTSILPAGVRVNDIYSYSLGAYILGCVLFAASKDSSSLQYVRNKVQTVDYRAWAQTAIKRGTQTLKCAYVYGFLALILPVIVAFLLQFYLILPLHTYAVASLQPAMEAAANSTNNALNATEITASFLQFSGDTQQPTPNYPKLAEHGIHLLADVALSMLYLRIGFHWIITAPTSRAAEALRRITANGALNPDAWLATRFFILPALLISTIMLLVPLGLAKLGITAIELLSTSIVLNDAARTMIYRFSYPLSAGFVLIVMGSLEVAKATARWRARIRDEVYLVGERLHNFGEKRPPTGSKSVVRKDK